MPLLATSISHFIAEGLTKLILESDIAGISVGNTTHKLSQFADDTQLLLKGYSERSQKYGHSWTSTNVHQACAPMLKKSRNPVWITQTHHGPTGPHTEGSHYSLGQT